MSTIAEGTWYHRTDDVDYKNEMVYYTIAGEVNRIPVSKEGVVYPGSYVHNIGLNVY